MEAGGDGTVNPMQERSRLSMMMDARPSDEYDDEIEVEVVGGAQQGRVPPPVAEQPPRKQSVEIEMQAPQSKTKSIDVSFDDIKDFNQPGSFTNGSLSSRRSQVRRMVETKPFKISAAVCCILVLIAIVVPVSIPKPTVTDDDDPFSTIAVTASVTLEGVNSTQFGAAEVTS